jgi:hypothetical protein
MSAAGTRAIFCALLVIGSVQLSAIAQAGNLARCEVVVLYPGYPGYTGNLPDTKYGGETACLADLEARDPAFSRTTVDAVNRAAALRLGIRGDVEDWTWEAWMAIEADRGLTSHCHSCVYMNGIDGVAAGPPVPLNDPRRQLGTFDDHYLARSWLNEKGYSLALIERMPSDDQMRALFGIFYGLDNRSPYPTASELPASAASFFDLLFNGNGFLDTQKLWRELIAQGGYVPTPAGATEIDQVYVIAEGLFAMSPYMVNSAADILISLLQKSVDDWKDKRLQGSWDSSFAEYLRSVGADQWY